MNPSKCPICNLLPGTKEIKKPAELFEITDKVKELIGKKHFSQIDGTVFIEDVSRNSPWPDDAVFMLFACSLCTQQYQLFCETYHGRGGQWARVSKTEFRKLQKEIATMGSCFGSPTTDLS